MASRVTPPVEDEGEKVDGAEEAEGVAVLVRGCLRRSWALLCQMVAASMTLIIVKGRDLGKETEKWQRNLMIVEGKISLSRVVVSL